MGQINFIGSLLLTAVFSVSIILFMGNFAIDNNTQISVTDNEGYNNTRTQIMGNLSNYRTETINSSESFFKSEISEGDTVKTGGQFQIGTTDALSTTNSALKQGFISIFGEDNEFGWVLNTLLGFLSFVLLLLIWKTWAGRNPE